MTTLSTHVLDVERGVPAVGVPVSLFVGETRLVEARTVAPTFYTDFPTEVSPLTRAHRKDPRLAERWDLVAFGMELGTAYTELIHPDTTTEMHGWIKRIFVEFRELELRLLLDKLRASLQT